ncbi:hypothetical protein TNCV_2305061 [Trichonephila clavipes]|nr:hypothetical protein TNCV_2305061 [Trichonephila clavipes]
MMGPNQTVPWAQMTVWQSIQYCPYKGFLKKTGALFLEEQQEYPDSQKTRAGVISISEHLSKVLLSSFSGNPFLKSKCGLGSTVAKYSWPACHEFEPSTAEYPPCKVTMDVKSVDAQTSSRSCDVEVKRGDDS